MKVKCDRCGSQVDKREIAYYEVNKHIYGHFCDTCARELNLKK